MTPEQAELDFTTPRDPEAHPRLRELIDLLRARGPLTSRQLEAEGFKDRELRAIVESDTRGDILSYPGSKGYALFDHASFAEVTHAPEALISQGRRMIRRGLIYRRRRHRHHPAEQPHDA